MKAMEKSRPNDEELFASYLGGDHKSFEKLLDRYSEPLLGYIGRLVRDRVLAEDIMQEVFIKVIKGAHSFDASQSFKSWIYAISHNACMDHLRRSKPEINVDPMPEVKSGENPEALASTKELSSRLEDALAGLKPEIREVFLMREQSGLSFKEISGITGASLNTVLGRMHQAINKLKGIVREMNHVN